MHSKIRRHRSRATLAIPGSPLAVAIALSLAPALPASVAMAQSAETGAPSARALEQVTIVGNASSARQLTGAAQIIGPEELERYQYTDIQRIIRHVPGVAVQVEDGFGLRPNLSIRGTASDRSAKLV